MGWLSLIGSIITGAVMILRWWFSSHNQKERAFKHDEKERVKFRNDLARGDLESARARWMSAIRKTRYK